MNDNFFAELRKAKFYYIPGTDMRYENNLRAHLVEDHRVSKIRSYKVDGQTLHESLHFNSEHDSYGAASGHHHYFIEKESAKRWDEEVHEKAKWLG